MCKILFFGKKKQQPQNQKANVKEQVGVVRKGGVDVKEALLGIQFVCKNNRIPTEKLEKCKKLMESYGKKLDDYPAMAMDTSVIDDCLKQMAVMLQEAVTNGYPNTMKEICENLRTGIMDIRRPTEDQWQLEQKNAAMVQSMGILKYVMQQEKTEQEIEELKAQIEHGKERYREAYKAFREIADVRRDVVEALERFPVVQPPQPILGDVIILQAKKKNVVTLFNSLKQAKEIMGVKENRRTSIIQAIATMRNQIQIAQNRLDPGLLRLQEQMQKDIEEALAQEKEENAKLREIANEFDASLEAYFSDPEIVNEIIATDINFSNLLESERQEEENKRLAREEHQKQTNAQNL